MTDLTPETLAQWRADARVGLHDDSADYVEVSRRVLALLDALERTQRGARTLGHVVERQCRDVLDITGLHDWIDEDGDGDWGAVWENAHELLPRTKEAERERDEAREALARVEAYAADIERTAAECERLAGIRSDLSDASDLRTAVVVNRKRAEGIRAALRGPSDTEDQA